MLLFQAAGVHVLTVPADKDFIKNELTVHILLAVCDSLCHL
jgi:hypothetical protein